MASIRDPNPVIFLEPKALYRGAEEEVPTQDYELELHVADVMQKGTDITLIGWGAQLRVIKEVIIAYIIGIYNGLGRSNGSRTRNFLRNHRPPDYIPI